MLLVFALNELREFLVHLVIVGADSHLQRMDRLRVEQMVLAVLAPLISPPVSSTVSRPSCSEKRG